MTMQPGASETAVVKKSRAVAYVLASIPIEWHRLCTASRIDASSSTTCTIAFSSDWGFIPLHPRPAGTNRNVLQSKAYCDSTYGAELRAVLPRSSGSGGTGVMLPTVSPLGFTEP